MTYSFAEYQKENELLQRIALVQSAFIKEAGIAETFQQIFENITNLVSNRIKREGIGAVLTYGLPYFVGWRMKAILIALDSLLGISTGNILSKALNLAKEKITSSGGSFSKEDAAQIADQSVSEIGIQASFKPLYNLEKRGQLHSTIKIGRSSHDSSMIDSFMSFVSNTSKRNQKSLGGGLIRKLIMSILLGIVAMEGPALAKSIIENETIEKQPENYSVEGTGKSVQTIATSIPSAQSHNLKPSGQGETHHLNSGNTRWIVPLINQNIKSTMIYWTISVYPQLKGYEQKIMQLASFNKMASILTESYNQNPGLPRYLIIPINTELHTIKDIVDRFAGDASQLIEGTKNE